MSSQNDETLQIIRTSSYLKRYHTLPSHEHQTIAHHSWNVAALVQFMWPDCRKDLILAALYHDVPEALTGDIPAPFKWANPDISEILERAEKQFLEKYGLGTDLTDAEKRMLSIADTLELVLYCQEQVSMGNQIYALSMQRGLAHLVERYGRYPEFKPVERVIVGISSLVKDKTPSEYN